MTAPKDAPKKRGRPPKAKLTDEEKKKLEDSIGDDADEDAADDQLDLIDVTPENAKDITRTARAYRRAQRARMDAALTEAAAKEKLLAVVKEAHVTPNADGTYKFRVNGCVISVVPRDEVVRVKFDDDAKDED